MLVEAEKKGITPQDQEEKLRTLPHIQQQLKALIARDIWDSSEYFEIMYSTHKGVQKAVELLEKE